MRTSLLLLCVLTSSAVLRVPAVAQTPLESGQAMVRGKSALEGDWVNVDPKSRGLVRITLHDSTVHPFGACHPTACDWGQLPAQSFASRVDKYDRYALLASHDTRFSKVLLTITLESDGRLRVEDFVHFTDGSGRADYSSIDYFTPSEHATPQVPSRPAP